MVILAPEDTPPVRIINGKGRSELLLLGDHAGKAVPARLAQLGLSEFDLARHIGQDIGVSALGAGLAQLLDAVFIEQRYSRLAVDCNRQVHAPDAMAAVSDGTVVPGNRDIPAADRAARVAEIYDPYHRAIAAALVARQHAAQPPVLVALHSFTPQLVGGAPRPWDIGVLHGGGDIGFAQSVLTALRARADLCIGDNEPYRMNDIDHTVPYHAFAAGLRYAELEVNQRRLADVAAVADMAGILAAVLGEAQAGG